MIAHILALAPSWRHLTEAITSTLLQMALSLGVQLWGGR